MEEDGCYSQQTQTQQQTQATQSQSSQQFPAHLWGVLVSCSPSNPSNQADPSYHARPDRFEFENGITEYTVGRSPHCSIVLSAKKISVTHCRIFKAEDGSVRVEDKSTNGTYVRGSKIGKGGITTLDTGDEIIFGQATSNFAQDFRYIFRSAASSAPEMIQTALSSYEIKESIGKGSFATVYKGIQKSTGREVAIKKIQLARFRDQPNTMRMLRREVEVQKGLSHEFCVEYLDYFEDHQFMYLIQELLTGGDLLGYIMKSSGLTESTTKKIARMALTALDYMHRMGVAHRDIKPENILLTKGKNPICKITDFGLAKMAAEGTELRTLCGTPTYLAPEVILGQAQGPYDFAVDAFSIGVVLFSCLVNATPFVEDSQIPLVDRMKARTVNLDELRGCGVTEIGIDLIAKLLIFDPKLRITTANALLHPWLSTSLALVPLGPQPPLVVESTTSTPAIPQEESFGYSSLRLESPVVAKGMMSGSIVSIGGEADQSTETEKASEAGDSTVGFLGGATIVKPFSEPITTFKSSGTKRKSAPSSAFSSDSSLDGHGSSLMELDSSNPKKRHCLEDYSPSIASTEFNEDIKMISPEVPSPTKKVPATPRVTRSKKVAISTEKKRGRGKKENSLVEVEVKVSGSDRVTRSRKAKIAKLN